MKQTTKDKLKNPYNDLFKAIEKNKIKTLR